MPDEGHRPVPWPTDAEFCAVIARTKRLGDRTILLVLRMHDYNETSTRGAYPGYMRVAALTGLSPGYVRNRLSAMVKVGTLQTHHFERQTDYYIVPPGATAGVITSPASASRPAPAHSHAGDAEPLYDDQGRPSAALRALADEYWPGRSRSKTSAKGTP